MKLYELNSADVEGANYDPNADEYGKRHIGQSRSGHLFLRQLNRLKKMRALKRVENMKRQDLLGVMYGEPESDGGGFGGPPGF